jgi:cytochrome c peroxidase
MRCFIFLFTITIFLTSCQKEAAEQVSDSYILEAPVGFPPITIPEDNPMTKTGVELGRMLFYDPILSLDSSISCGTCHNPNKSFSSPLRFNLGVFDSIGRTNAIALVNVAYNPIFLWDGRDTTLEVQALGTIKDPIEMHETFSNVVNKLKNSTKYRQLFERAFNTTDFNELHIAKAIAQFERTILSSDSKIDRLEVFKNNQSSAFENESQFSGYQIFFSERGDCFHCHGNILGTDFLFHNNGLDATIDGTGLGRISKNSEDDGKFKTPTLRNVEFTAPYMHDGRFQTLKQVIDFYSEGLENSRTIDPLMKNVAKGGLQLTEQEKNDLLVFVLMFSDSSFNNNPALTNPFN